MLKRVSLFACDLLVIAASAVLALLLRDNFETAPEQLVSFIPYAMTTTFVGGACLLALGLHRGVWRLSVMSDYLRVVAVAWLTVVLTLTIGFIGNRLTNIARALPIIQFVVSIVGLVGLRVAARNFFAWHHGRATGAHAPPDFSRETKTVLLIGLNRLTMLYIRSIEDLAEGRVRVAGILADEWGAQGRSVDRHQVLGHPESVSDVISSLAVHGVFVSHIVVLKARSELGQKALDQLASAARRYGLTLEFFQEAIGPAMPLPGPQAGAQTAATVALREASRLNAHFWQYARRPYWRVKRSLDVVGSAALIIALAPLIFPIGIVVALNVGWPVIFWQQRPGAKGVPFRVYKFRTMGVAHDGQGRRRTDLERTSRLGHVLRTTRLDELPQLFNVLVGHMSFIGPRPLLPIDQFPGLEARLAIVPGITGWAQVNGGREISAADKAALDLWYLKNASLGVDLWIALSTLLTLVRGETTNPQAIEVAWASLRTQVSEAGVLPSEAEPDGNPSLSWLTSEQPGKAEGAQALA